MSKYSDKKRAKVLGTYVPPYDRSERVKSKYSPPTPVSPIDNDEYMAEYNRFLRSRDANPRRHFS